MQILGYFLFSFISSEIFGLCICDKIPNYTFGSRLANDRLLIDVTLQAKPKFGIIDNTRAKAQITFDAKRLKGKRITAIQLEELKDQNFKTAKAYVEITDGGINDKEVTMLLKSRKGYGFKYRVQIFGKA